MTAALEVQNLCFTYETMAMRFDLTVESGVFLALIGPSGAGKSTLLNLIAGFEAPEAGSIRLFGQEVIGLPPARRPVTTVFQDNNLFDHLNCGTNVRLGLLPASINSRAAQIAATAALAQVGLAGFDTRPVRDLSGGQRQRVAIARALVRAPTCPLLLLDEPFAALGPAQRRDMLDLIEGLRQTHGLTVILVNHHPDEARHAAQFCAFLDAGRIVALDETTKLLARSDVPGLTAYLGDT
ncbi:thiamine ABC transporter ATP-binding protein [Elstera litoralis]|nr:ATP-binding cassette domain-containing protein [Elstera litoralis]